jgi:hypothetical protein
MKKSVLLFAVLLLASSFTFAQQPGKQKKEKIYSFGTGIMNENDIGNLGIVVTNDLKIYLLKRFGINPRLSYFQSLGQTSTLDPGNPDDFSSYSALFVECGLFYSFVKNQKVEITLNAGPSGVFGNSSYLELVAYDGNGNKIQERFNNEHITSMAYFTDLEFSWGKRKIVNTLAIKATGMYIYPEFLSLVYKIGFRF